MTRLVKLSDHPGPDEYLVDGERAVIGRSTEVEVSETIETESEVDDNSAEGDPDNMASFDSEAKGTPAVMGAGASGGGGGGGKFGHRGGGSRRNAVRKGGGSRKTENAVDAALRWLKEHQEPDGSWDNEKYEGKGKNDPAVTAFALLAFLGAGNSMEFGKYKTTVKKGVQWLMKQHDGNGRVGPHRYQAPITMMALAEAYGMSSGAGAGGGLGEIIDEIRICVLHKDCVDTPPERLLDRGRRLFGVVEWRVS